MTHPLPIALAAAVPLWQLRLEARGGPDNTDWERAREFSQVLAEKADVLMFGSKQKGEAATLFNRLAEALAIMSYVPGGVSLDGNHWESGMPTRSPPPEELTRAPLRLRLVKRERKTLIDRG